MRSLSAEVLAALAADELKARDFLAITARTRDTFTPVAEYLWSDVGTITAEVIDPTSGTAVERSWYGVGELVSVSDIPLVSNITVQNITITMSQVSERVEELVRTYDAKLAPVELFRGLFDPSTRTLVAPAPPRFVGRVNNVKITTPKEGEEGSVVLECVSDTQELTRANPVMRSHESQVLRSSSDNFYADTAVVGSWELFWGKSRGVVIPRGQGRGNGGAAFGASGRGGR